MASVWKKTMLYLGLGADEEYDSTAVDAPLGPGQERRPAQEAPEQVSRPAPRPGPVSAVRPVPAAPGGGRPSPSGADPAAPSSGTARSLVRPLPPASTAKPHVVTPRSFNEAQAVADQFKSKTPVIVNMQEAERDLSRRLIDFCSGLCYGLGGHMEKVANQVYLLTPSDVEVSAEERRLLSERGLHDS